MRTFLIDEGLRQNAVSLSGILEGRAASELDSIVSGVAEHYQADFAAVTIITRDTQVLVAKVGTEIAQTPRKDSFCQITIRSSAGTLVVPDAREDVRFSALATVTGGLRLRFYAGVRITDSAGYPLGALCVGAQEPRHEETDLSELVRRAAEVERLIR